MFESAAALIILLWVFENGSDALKTDALNLMVGTAILNAAYYAILWAPHGKCDCVCTACRKAHRVKNLHSFCSECAAISNAALH